ncbi:MAG: Trk system potassium transporter TrkA [Clostridia bacterium]|nr:Trk system potassium transporter TrkA [Clostridia bacterium]
MKIIIAGCGKVGISMLTSLLDEGHDVVVIDNDTAAITELTNLYDAMCVCGNGADSDTLKEAGVTDCDLFAAVTYSDELNMLACFMARKLGAKNTIARIRNPEYNDKSLSFMRHHLDLSVSINPELLNARELFNRLRMPGAVNIETFSGRSLEMVELLLKDSSPMIGLSLSELRQKYKAKFLICIVRRGDEVYIPDGNFVLQAGDHIAITAAPSESHKLFKTLGMLQKQSRNMMILGASRTAYYLTKMLLSMGVSVTVIEKNHKRCKEFSEVLPGAVVIEGDGAAQEVLLEEGLRSMDAFVALTGMDEENILISIFAASQNVPQVISKINRPELVSLAKRLGLDNVVAPRKIVSNYLCRYARALENSKGSEMETLYKLMDEKAEALEFIVRGGFEWADVPLKELSLRSNTLIAGIIRGRKTIIPTGDDRILPGDHVIVIAKGQRVNALSDIFK